MIGFKKLLKFVLYLFRFLICFIFFVYFASYNIPWSLQHIAIISTTYFHYSSSYAPQTMVILFNSNKNIWLSRPLMCVSQNETHGIHFTIANVQYAFTPIFICQWTVFLATCSVRGNPTEFALTDLSLDSNQIPYQLTHSAKSLGVVSCFSPLFYNERWQLIIPTLELYRQMGVSLQVYYVQSMIVNIFKLLKEYEKQNVVRVKPWARINAFHDNIESWMYSSSLGFDPNTELEWRNQASAHTDCLLKYKEAAEFIIISDIDDVLIPRLGSTFLDEFRHLSILYPSATGFSYNRYNTKLITSNDSKNYSLSKLLKSALISNEWEDPKYVVRPEKVESVWLHWPGIIKSGQMKTVPDQLNFMLHFRNWTLIDYNKFHIVDKNIFSLFKYQINQTINPEKADRIEQNFQNFLKQNKRAASLFKRMPNKINYYPIIAECYNKIFYRRGRHPLNCPGPQRCQLPSIEGLKCAVAEQKTKHRSINKYTMVYVLDSFAKFSISNNGCKI